MLSLLNLTAVTMGLINIVKLSVIQFYRIGLRAYEHRTNKIYKNCSKFKNFFNTQFRSYPLTVGGFIKDFSISKFEKVYANSHRNITNNTQFYVKTVVFYCCHVYFSCIPRKLRVTIISHARCFIVGGRWRCDRFLRLPRNPLPSFLNLHFYF